MIDPETAFHVLAILVLGVLALAVALALWWAVRYWRMSACALLACGLALAGCDSGGGAPWPALAMPSAPPVQLDPAGCPTSPTPQPGDPAPRRAVVTPRGVVVEVPAWLDLHPADLAAALAEVDTVTPDADSRIASTLRGVPVGVRVVVLDPGAYYAPSSPTGLAAGEWRAPSTIYCAWRGVTTDPRRLPALAHELRHALTQDPLAGH